MDSKAFKRDGADMLEYIGDFWNRMSENTPLHNVEPGYLTAEGVLPSDAPDEPESLKAVLQDVDKYIMPGMTQWHHPNFFAYFLAALSYPSLLAEMLSGAFGCVGFTSNSSPACSELEIVMLNWLGRLIQLPETFLNIPGGSGGGVIQGSACEATIVALLAARTRKLRQLHPAKKSEGSIDKFVCYTSQQSHSSVERAALIGHVTVRHLPTDEKFSLKGETLQKAIDEDRKQGLIPFYASVKQGLIPFYVVATIGTTSVCSYDNLTEIGPICEKESLWLHIDAAYAGSAAICPEYRHLIDGVEFADSFDLNPHKWLMVNPLCSAMWMKDRYLVADAFKVDPLFLQHHHDSDIIDFRHLQLPLSRTFRSLKLWFVFRLLGVKALQKNIRKQISLAKEFEKMVKEDNHYEIVGEVTLGLVCFRIKGGNDVNKALMRYINNVDRRIHLVPGDVDDTYFLRLAICSTKTESDDIKLAWKVVQESAEKVIMSNGFESNGVM